MRLQFQFAPRDRGVSRSVRLALAGLLVGAMVLWPQLSRAQTSPFSAVARIEGRDISCENGTPATGITATIGPSLEVSNGTIVTVHSGQAVMTLFEGGHVDICGPAKFSVLVSAGDITLALNFGRVRLELPPNTALRIFTPTVIGTPIDIRGGARDVTVGLSLDDSLCVLATSGAIQLEHQFTGEKLIVPQSGEFFLNAGRLLPVAGTPGSCQCTASGAAPIEIPPPPRADYAVTVSPPPPPAPVPVPPVAPVVVKPPPAPETQPNFEVTLIAPPNETHPIVPPAKNTGNAAPPAPGTVPTTVVPALTFMAGSPARPPDPAPDMLLLIREARVSPDWEFTGHVPAPEFAQAMQQALGEKTPSAQTQAQPPAQNQPAAKPAKKKGGFWASLKRVFGGGGSS